MPKSRPATIKFQGATYRLAVSDEQAAISRMLKQVLRRLNATPMFSPDFDVRDVDHVNLADPNDVMWIREGMQRVKRHVDSLSTDLGTALGMLGGK